MITLNDYAPGSEGFMGGEDAGKAELLKAMQAGQITGRDTTGIPLTQEPLKVESLEKTLKNLESRSSDIKLYNAIPKMTAYNTVEEFIQLVSYGAQRGGFYDEGQNSNVEDSTYIRRAEKVKYMQVNGKVTLQAQMVKSYVDAMTQETKNKMMWLTRLADKALTQADSDIVPQQFNSIYKSHASVGSTQDFLYATFEAYYNSGTVIDLRGASLRQSDIEDGAVAVDAHYGNVDSLFAPTSVLSGVTKDYYDVQRIMQNGTGFKGQIGVGGLKSISTTIGDVNLMSDKFMAQDPAKTTATPSDSALVPTAAATLTVALAADATSKIRTAEIGNVFYAVAAVNAAGESNLTAYATAVTLAVGFSADLTITNGVGANALTGYTVYRTLVTAAATPAGLDFFPIFKVSNAQIAAGFNGGAATKVRDRAYFLPNLEQAFITEMSDEVLAIKQLAPLSKLDLAVTTMAREFIIFHFLCLQLSAPKKVVRYINISKKYIALA